MKYRYVLMCASFAALLFPAVRAQATTITDGTLLVGTDALAGSTPTSIGTNPSTFAGNFVDLQVNGTSQFKVDSSGNMTAIGISRLGDATANSNRGFARDMNDSNVANTAYGLNKFAALGVLNSSTGIVLPDVLATNGLYVANVSNYTTGTLYSQYGLDVEAWQNGLGSVINHLTPITVGGGVTNGTANNYYGIRVTAPAKLDSGDIMSQVIGIRIEDMTSRGFFAPTNNNLESRGANSNNWLEGKLRIGGAASNESVPTQVHITTKDALTSGMFIDTAVNQTADALQVRNSSGTPLMEVGPTGNVGIGIASPSANLHVYSSSSSVVRIESTSASALASFIVTGPTGFVDTRWVDTAGPNINLLNTPSTAVIRTTGSGLTFINASGSGYVRFATGGAAPTNERMRIDSTGKVGIGTTTPATKLDVNDNSIVIEQSQTPATSSSACTTGMLAWDANYTYICVATNTWKRSALSSW